MDPIQALVLEQQLAQLQANNQRRRQICRSYLDHLPPGWSLVYSSGEEFVGHLAVTVAPDERSCLRACEVLQRRQIAYDVHYPVLDCDQPAWRSGGKLADCKRARDLTKRIISLPCFPELTAPEIEQVIDAIHAFD